LRLIEQCGDRRQFFSRDIDGPCGTFHRRRCGRPERAQAAARALRGRGATF
jgi:hypothetical protein